MPLNFSTAAINMHAHHSRSTKIVAVDRLMDLEAHMLTDFDMDSLKISLPQKRGLSRYYSGKAGSFSSLAKAGSFSSLAEACCLEDLKKVKPEAKRRKKYRHRLGKVVRSLPVHVEPPASHHTALG